MPTKSIAALLICSTFLLASTSSLQKLCSLGIQNNPKLKSFAYKTKASDSYYDQSVDRYLPQMSVSGQYGNDNYQYQYPHSVEKYNGRSYNYQVSFRQPIFREQLIHGITDAKARRKLAQLQMNDERAKLVSMIISNSVELIRQRKIVDVLQKKTTVLEKAYQNIMKKFSMQLASNADKFQALAMMQQSKSDLVKAQQYYNSNLYNLRLLVKTQNVEHYVAPLDFNLDAVAKRYRHANFASIKRSIRDNTRVKLDRQSVEIAKIQIDLRSSERSPQVDAVLSYGDTGGTIDQVTRQNESKAMISLNYPFYQGGYVSDRTKEAKYLYYSAREEAENTRLDVEISMEKALQDIKGGLESFKAYRVAVEASRKNFEAMTQSYQSGMASLTDAYLAESDYRDNQIRLINSEADVFLALANAYYLSGKADIKHIKIMQRKFYKNQNNKTKKKKK
jgi:outer membrane protein